MTIQTVHPEYDTSTARWFVPGMRIQACCLADLQRSLGPQVKIEGYYPNGYDAVRPLNGHTAISALRSPMRTNYSGINRSQERNRAAYMARATAADAPELAAPPPILSVPLQNATRNRGRKRTANGLPRKADWDLILDAWLNGDEVCSIANRAHCSVSNIYEVARTARARGDKRAVVRKAFAWTPKAVVRLCVMVGEGRSGGDIAVALGAPSRSAVIGKANRLGLSLA